MGPYSFGAEPVEFALRVRRVPKRLWRDDDAFREDLFATPVEERLITVEPLL
jgi:hypothetical protein